jgi:putative endonuclease
MRVRQALGRFGEDLAEEYLRGIGFDVLARNWRCPAGEVDIVARDGSTLVVCEVKTRRGTGYGSPLEAVTPQKAARLARLGAMARRGLGTGPCLIRIDLVGVLVHRDGRVDLEHVRGVA